MTTLFFDVVATALSFLFLLAFFTVRNFTRVEAGFAALLLMTLGWFAVRVWGLA